MNKLCPGFFAQDGPGKIGSSRNRILFLNPTHRHAHMLCFHYYSCKVAGKLWLVNGHELAPEWDARFFTLETFMECLSATRNPLQVKQPLTDVDG